MRPFAFTPAVDRLIEMALEEDIGPGDITTDPIIPAEARGAAHIGRAVIVAKEDLVIAGLAVARRVFERLDADIRFDSHCEDGQKIAKGFTVVSLSGRTAPLLTGERTALNFLQRLSGIATHVQNYVAMLPGSAVKLLDTRKTTPGWRELEKYAVRTGGATNHRMGLYDAVRIKARVAAEMTIEVETTDLEEVQQALQAGAHIIMLDNMDLDQIRAAVALVAGRAKLEVSGGVTREHLRALADTGIDYISSGALTHSARAVDLSMKISL